MRKFDLQLFTNSAEAVQGKQIVYLFRVHEDAATDDGTVIAFTTENENSASADSDSTVTKDGVIQKPGAVTVEITGTAIVLKGDETMGEKLRNAMLHNKLVECWEADLSNTSSLLLMTRDNFTVALGNSESLHAKLRSMLLVRGKLAEMGKTSGSISVSNPETPYYSPDSPQ